MLSCKSRLFNFVLRHAHLLRGKLRKETFDDSTSIQAFRDRCERGASRFGKVPEGVTVEPLQVAGMRAEWLVPPAADRTRTILYVHGGGYVSGSCNDHRGIVAKLAQRIGMATLLYEYRLAPEHPFPAALDDSVEVYRWLLSSGFRADSILIAGESAGGGLALAVLLALKERGLPQPCAAVAISPWTDLTCSSQSYKSKNNVSVAPINSWFVFGKHYTRQHPASLPLISPLFGDLTGLPPLLINSGTDDELFDDGEKFHLKAKAAGVDSTFRAGEGMVHCYPLLAPMFREATEAMDEIAGFVKRRLGQG
jgi:acetyl esterase/lipase